MYQVSGRLTMDELAGRCLSQLLICEGLLVPCLPSLPVRCCEMVADACAYSRRAWLLLSMVAFTQRCMMHHI